MGMYKIILEEFLKSINDPGMGISLSLAQTETLAEIAAEIAQDTLQEMINIKTEKIIEILEE